MESGSGMPCMILPLLPGEVWVATKNEPTDGNNIGRAKLNPNQEGDYFLYPGSEHQYTIRKTIDGQEYYFAHKAILPNTTNKVRVALPGKAVSKDLKFKTDAGTYLNV